MPGEPLTAGERRELAELEARIAGGLRYGRFMSRRRNVPLVMVEEKNGSIIAGGKLIWFRDGPDGLHYDHDGLLAALRLTAWTDIKLIRCPVCRQLFVGHISRRACSAYCRAVRAAEAKYRFKVRRGEARRRYFNTAPCDHCRRDCLSNAKRESRVYCSNKCRQAAYRERKRNRPR